MTDDILLACFTRFSKKIRNLQKHGISTCMKSNLSMTADISLACFASLAAASSATPSAEGFASPPAATRCSWFRIQGSEIGFWSSGFKVQRVSPPPPRGYTSLLVQESGFISLSCFASLAAASSATPSTAPPPAATRCSCFTGAPLS